MNTVNNAANFNGQKPVIDPGDAVFLLIDRGFIAPEERPALLAYLRKQ